MDDCGNGKEPDDAKHAHEDATQCRTAAPAEHVDGFQRGPLAALVRRHVVHEHAARQGAAGIDESRAQHVQETDPGRAAGMMVVAVAIVIVVITLVDGNHGKHEGNARPLEGHRHVTPTVRLGQSLTGFHEHGLQERCDNVEALDGDGSEVETVDKEERKVANRHAGTETRNEIGNRDQNGNHAVFGEMASVAKDVDGAAAGGTGKTGCIGGGGQ